MSRAKAKIWARLIYKGVHVVNDAPLEYRELILEAYYELYGELPK